MKASLFYVNLFHSLRTSITALFLVLMSTAVGFASNYRLNAGDELDVSIFGEQSGWKPVVAPDGTVRLPGVGSIEIGGRTLDEAEKLMKEAITKSGLYLEPSVWISVSKYAPVFVTGHVRTPGAFPYSAQLTAGTAVGLAGGVSVTSGAIDTVQSAVVQAQIAGDLLRFAGEERRLRLRLLRAQAQIEARNDANLRPDWLQNISGPERLALEELIKVETDTLANAIRLSETASVQWADEEREINTQIETLARRTKVQDGIVALQRQRVQASSRLKQRGLRTLTDETRTQQDLAAAEARILEIESALAQARSRASALKRERSRFFSTRRAEALAEARDLRNQLQETAAKMQTLAQRQIAIQTGTSEAASTTGATAAKSIFFLRRRDGNTGFQTRQVEPDEQLLPGDSITVRMELSTVIPPAPTPSPLPEATTTTPQDGEDNSAATGG